MALGEFHLSQALVRVAGVLDQVRVLCDRAHEENLIALRDAVPRELACHYAYALGTVMQTVQHGLDELARLGVRREGDPASVDAANARALASLESFKRQVRALEPVNVGRGVCEP
jgi:hypothetical protein